MKRIELIAAAMVGLALCQANIASASAFRVTPVQVEFPGKSSALLTLANESKDTLRFQVTAFSWTQNSKGEMQLTPTQDIAFFPALLTLAAGEERKVRVASNVPAGEVEKTYRIFFEELPPAEKPAEQKTTQVRILTKMGVPIFIVPSKPVAETKIGDVNVARSHLRFVVTNPGNAHLTLQHVNVVATSASGEKILEKSLDGWYLLARSSREYGLDLPAGVCGRVHSLKIETTASVGATSVQQPVDPATACK